MVRALSLRLIYQFIGALAALVFGTLTARWLGPHDKGLVSIITLIAYMVSLIGALGVNEALAYLRNRRGFSAGEIFAGLVLFNVVWGGVLAVGTVVVVYHWGPALWHTAFPFWLALTTGLLAVTRLLLVLGKSHLLAEGRYGLANGIDVAFVLLPLAVLFPLVWWRGAGVGPVTFSTLLATIAVVVPLLIANWRYRERVQWARLCLLAREGWRYSLRTLARIAGAVLLYRINVFLVGSMLDLRAVGWYTVALMFSEMLLKIPDAITWLLTPQVARTSEDAVNGVTARYLRWTLIISGLLALLMAVIIPCFIPRLLTARYNPAIVPSLWLLPGGLFACVYQLLSSSLTGRGKVGSSIAPTWIGVAAMMALNWFAIPRWGLPGAAASASLAYGIAAGALVWQYRAATGGSVKELFFLQPADRKMLRHGWSLCRRLLWVKS